MRGARFRWIKVPKRTVFSEPHVHCEICEVEFKNTKAAGCLKEGYESIGRIEWLCRSCFTLYKETYGWLEDRNSKS